MIWDDDHRACHAAAMRQRHLAKTRAVLATIETMTRDRPGLAPSLRELATASGIAPATVMRALATLRDEYGYIAYVPGVERSVRLLPHT